MPPCSTSAGSVRWFRIIAPCLPVLLALAVIEGAFVVGPPSAPGSGAVHTPQGTPPGRVAPVAPVQAQSQGEQRDPAEAVAEFLEQHATAERPQSFRYFRIPPRITAAPAGAAPGTPLPRAPATPPPSGDAVAAQSVLTKPIADAYDRPIAAPGQPAESPRQLFDRFLTEAGARAAQGQHGEEGMRLVHDPAGPWGDGLIRATVQMLDSAGSQGPKAIKQLIRDRAVIDEHSALMWTARNLIVRRMLDRVHARLKQMHPGLRIEISCLDSGSYGSIGSDIDKTLHLTAWDAAGKEVKALGPGGEVLGGDTGRFLQMVVGTFNDIGAEFGAKNPITGSMDTEFFSSDTLPERIPGRLARGATHGSVESPINRGAQALRRNFAALRANPGPAYQLVAKIVAQVIGRVVEQDVLLQQRIDELGRKRQDLDRLSTADRRGLFLQEMLTSMHAPAVVVSDESGRLVTRAMDVIEFLERNNLAIRYPADMAAANAAGDHEKLTHKVHYIIDGQGRFHADQYDLYRNDIAKYGIRSKHDTAMMVFADDPSKPAKFGEFNRRFGAAKYKARFGVDPPANLREYTLDVHRALFEPALERLHASGGMTPEARQRIETDLMRYWASNSASETLMAIKDHPSLGNSFPPEKIFADLVRHIETHEPARFGDLAGLTAEQVTQRKIQIAQRVHVEAEERGSLLLVGGYMERALDTWFRSPGAEYQRIVTSEQGKLQRLRTERDRHIRQVAPAGSPESAAKQRELRTLNAKIEEAADFMRWMQSSPEEVKVTIQNEGREFARRLFELYVLQAGDSPEGARQRANFSRMIGLVGPDYRRDLELMWRVWQDPELRTIQRLEAPTQEGQEGVAGWRKQYAAFQAALDDVARTMGTDLTRAATWSADVSERLSYGYAQSFGIDMDAVFRSRAGAPVDPRVNAAGPVLGRFVLNNYLHIGLASTPLNLIRTMQLSRGLPYEQRMAMMADAVGTEIISPIPAIGPIYLTWKGYKANDPKAVAGGIVNGVQELAQQWIGVAASSLDEAMTQAGQGARVAAIGRFAQAGGLLPLVLNLARTGVEIVGTEVFDPLQDLYFQLAYKGYVDVSAPGIWTVLRDSAIQRGQSRIDVTPIIEPHGTEAFEFLYLKPELAQRYLDDLRGAGETAAAVALLRLAGLDENLDSGFDPRGTCGDANPAACPVLIDLRTDFDALIADARRLDIDLEGMPAGMLARAEKARASAIDVWQGLAALRRVTQTRINHDRELDRRVPDHLNLYLLAGRENLGLALDPEFQRQQQLLYQRLVGVPGTAEVFAREAEEAWSTWKAMAPSWEAPDRIRQQFLQVMSPRLIYESRVEALRAQVEQIGQVPWGLPSTMTAEYVARRWRRYLGLESPADVERHRQAEPVLRQIAVLGAFVSNSYANRHGATPTEDYTLDGATAWYSDEIRSAGEFLRKVPWIDPPPGQALVDVYVNAQQNKARLEEEYALVMQAFSEMDSVVAPKIAQLLLMNWIGAKDPYPNDAHAALAFLWQDAATQQRIRTKLEQDLARGRQLIPRYRSQAAAYRTLLDAELSDIYVEFLRLQEDQVKQTQRQSLRVAEARADARRPPDVFPGALELHVEPYFIHTNDGLDVVVDTRVDHEIYRAVDVEVKTDVRLVPAAEIAAVAGRDAYARALEWSGLDEREVLFAAVVSAKVVRAEPPPGHEDKAYPREQWPSSEGHLLLVPYTVAEAPVLETPAVSACPIRDDAPDEFLPRDAVDYCDPARAPHEYDRVAVFFTPPRDLREPLADRAPFHWRIIGPNGHAVPLRGSMYGTWAAFAPKLAERRSTPFAKAGSPARFAAVVDLWNRRDKPDPAAATRGPGTYTVQTLLADYGAEGTFGQGDSNTVKARVGTQDDGSPKYADWEDVASFDVRSSRLYFQGFVMESVHDVWLPDRDDLWEGKLTVDTPQRTGSTVVLGANAWLRKAHRDGTGRRPRDEVHRARTRVTIDFPEEFAPGHEEMGEIRARIEPVEKGEYLLTAGMHLMIPTTQLPPDRHLVQGTALPAPWAAVGALPDDYCQSLPSRQERFLTRAYFGDGSWVWSGKALPVGCDAREPAQLDARTVLLSGAPRQLAGLPARSLLAHLQVPSTVWVIPVFIDLTDRAMVRDHARTLEMRTYGYAIYAAAPGTYQGPPPTGGPAVGDGPDPVRPDPARPDPARPDPTRTDPARPDPTRPDPTRPDPTRLDPARPDPTRPDPTRPDPARLDPARPDPVRPDPTQPDPARRDPTPVGTPVDPTAIDPTGRDVAPLIREWLTVAEPVENAGGASFRYDAWGRLVGSAAPGMGRTVGAQPPPDGGGVPEAYAWRQRTKLDSIDHCTLEQYVMAKMGDASTSHCAGRYRRTVAVPDVTGLPLADAVGQLRRQGLEIVPRLLGPAPSRELAGRVATQRPSRASRLAPGAKVEVDVHGNYTEPRAGVPDLRGLTLPEAQRVLRDAGLGIEPSLLGAAPTAAQALKIHAQTPAPGATVAPGTAVRIDLWGEYAAPPPAPPAREEPSPVVRTGRPNVQCPASPFGQQLVGAESGFVYSSDTYDMFNCVYANPGGLTSYVKLAWTRNAWYAGSWCGKDDMIFEGIPQPYAQLYGKSHGHGTTVELRWQPSLDRNWIFGLARDLRAAFGPYTLPCPGAGITDSTRTVTPRPPPQPGTPRWVLVETRINAGNEPTEFVVGVTPNYFSDRFNGSYERWSVGESSLTYSRRWQDRGVLQCDATLGANFSPPPRELVPGQTVNLAVSFTHRGVAPADNPVIRFEFRGQGFTVGGTPSLAYAPFAPNDQGASSIRPSFTVPRTHGGEIRLIAFLWNCGACNVTWVYRAQQQPPKPEEEP